MHGTMRWLFVGEALVLRKEQRILAFIVLIHTGSPAAWPPFSVFSNPTQQSFWQCFSQNPKLQGCGATERATARRTLLPEMIGFVSGHGETQLGGLLDEKRE